MKWVPAGLVAVLLACPAGSAGGPPREEPQDVEDLVARLGDPSYAAREAAQRELWLRGDAAIPALEKIAKGEDPEAARRARELLDAFGWGLRPDTPPAVVKLVRQFQAGGRDAGRTDEGRRRAVADLLKMGQPGVAVVRAILAKNLPDDARHKLTTTVTQFVRREVPLLLVAGKTAEADELVSLHATGTTPEGAADFAAYHALRGDLPAVIAEGEDAPKSGRRAAQTRLVLTHLHRAAGMWAKARAAAAELPRGDPNDPEGPAYREMLLEDEGNWPALADAPPGGELNHPEAVRLTLLRLAGRAEKFDAAAKKLRDDADEFTRPTDVMNAAVALLSNHRAGDATDLLLEKRQNLALLSEVLIARMRYREALALIGEGKAGAEGVPAAERLDFKLRRARVLTIAGERDAAVQLFDAVADELVRRPGRHVAFDNPARSLVRTELRVGLRDLACEHAVRFVAPEEARAAAPSGESPFEMLFPAGPVAAEALFDVLRANKVPGDQPGATMLRVRDLLDGAAGASAVDEAVRHLRNAASAVPVGGDRLLKSHRYLALAEVCRAAKRADAADRAFGMAAEVAAHADGAAGARGLRSWVYGAPDPARVWIDWGEFLADSGRHRDAAAVFEAGWRLFPDQALPLFLSGQALAKAGDAKEGGRRVELSHWVALGSEKVRGRFLDELVRRGEAKAIRREVGLILKACWSRDHFFGNVMNQCARGANLVGDFATAERCGQRSLLVVLRTPGVYFVDPAGYLNVPTDLLIFHARAELAAGRVAEAVAAARRVLAVTPGHVELVCGMVPELDRRGGAKEADALFELAWEAHAKVLADYPASPAARHALAQLAGHCRRSLDDGLKYAQEAVASDPGSRPYREALAEVHFRRGDRAAALKLMRALADEQPRNALYRRQLTRYRTAPLDSPWPYTAE